MSEEESVTLRFIIKLDIPRSVDIKYAKLDIPVIYRNEIESKNMKEILKVILIMKGFEIIDGPFEIDVKAERNDYKELQYGLSNLIGGVGALLEDSKLPETEDYPLEQWDDKYVVFNKNAFNHWLDSMKTVVGQIRGLID